MSEWTWVAAGYGIAYGSIATYAALLRRRRSRLRTEARGPS